MKAIQSLPNDYTQLFEVNLQKSKKLAIAINIFAVIIAIIMIVPAHFIVPISELFSFEQGIVAYIIRFAVLIVGSIAYIILHEAVHGITMKLFGARKIRYGFTGLYAYAGSNDDYFDKKRYIIIALAPVIIWGIVLGIIQFFVTDEWFWVVYWIQVSNISGAAGDLYVTAKFSKFPNDILVKDTGVEMTVYSKS